MGQGWQINPRTLDRVARIVITTGGLTLVAAVLAILVFIVKEAAPLAGKAKVTSQEVLAEPGKSAAILAGTDEYRKLGFLTTARGTRYFQLENDLPVDSLPSPFLPEGTNRCAHFSPGTGYLALGSDDGRAALVRLDVNVRWENSERQLVPSQRSFAVAVLDSLGGALSQVRGDRNSDGGVALAALVGAAAVPRYAYVNEEGEATLFERIQESLEGRTPTALALSLETGLLAIGTNDGTLFFWDLDDPEEPRFEDQVNAAKTRIDCLELLLGNQSLVVGAADGSISVWFRVRYARVLNQGDASVEVEGVEIGPGASMVFRDTGIGQRYAYRPEIQVRTAGRPWTRVHSFEVHHEPIVQLAASPRVRGFASLDSGGMLALHQSTSERTLLQMQIEADTLRSLAFAPRGDGMVGLDERGRAHFWRVDNPHPEAGVRALFGKVWYEGYAQPEYVWQSTGGSDEFEPKLSLVPLFVGTLKGTLYAMLFSIPLSILGALYLSQLATPRLRNMVKPAVELMAAVPSVVVGFLAALWLAPLMESNLAAWGTGVLMLPVGLALALALWLLLPRTWRLAVPAGTELLFMAPFLVAAVWFGASIGGPLERTFFGGDLKQWLYDTNGIHYDQRNCIVVGIALGVAVIPIIFSICEDAMSSVPRSLTSASLALGASRWQTALHVILPAASPGIFAAVMLGLGRAIGETMIVLMATGNTPILDLSPFNGMRTMSAAIAVEIPEAPLGGTLYRVLFLTGAILFLFTFLINTGADLIGRHLRKRYAQF